MGNVLEILVTRVAAKQEVTATICNLLKRRIEEFEKLQRFLIMIARFTACCGPLGFNSHLKQMHISNKMWCFDYKGECGMHGHICIKACKRNGQYCMHYYVALTNVF